MRSNSGYVRYPSSPADVYRWVVEGFTGVISYAKIDGFHRNGYPGLARVKDSNGNWVNIIPPQPDQEFISHSDSLPWDAVKASLEVESDNWLGTQWEVRFIPGWIQFRPPEHPDKSYKIKYPGHPQFAWWFTHFVARHPELIAAVVDLPEDYELEYQPAPIPEGPEDIPSTPSGVDGALMAEISTKLNRILELLGD